MLKYSDFLIQRSLFGIPLSEGGYVKGVGYIDDDGEVTNPVKGGDRKKFKNKKRKKEKDPSHRGGGKSDEDTTKKDTEKEKGEKKKEEKQEKENLRQVNVKTGKLLLGEGGKYTEQNKKFIRKKLKDFSEEDIKQIIDNIGKGKISNNKPLKGKHNKDK